MSEANDVRLIKANLKQLRLPTMSAECEKLAREAATHQQGYDQYLLRLTELEVATRASNALAARIKQAAFGVFKDFDTFDFSALPSLNKQVLRQNLWVNGQPLGVCPRPRDFLRHKLRCPRARREQPRAGSATGLAPWAHRRLGYPWSGCVPAEPDAVSPSRTIVSRTDRRGQRPRRIGIARGAGRVVV